MILGEITRKAAAKIVTAIRYSFRAEEKQQLPLLTRAQPVSLDQPGQALDMEPGSDEEQPQRYWHRMHE